MFVIFYALAVVLIYLSYRSFRSGIEWKNFVESELARPAGSFAPFATVIVPCKGVDDGLVKNLEALRGQEYPNFETLFVIDDTADSSVNVIKSVFPDANIIIAKKAVASGQKVENIREAVRHVNESSEVLVFMDTDIRPARDWLRYLVAALGDEHIGAATGYRWFACEQPTLASELQTAWNASITSSLIGDSSSNFCWGGSTAIHRRDFERLNIREELAGTLSDDFTITSVLKEADLAIRFVPQAISPSFSCPGLRGFLEFSTRQIKITRVYSPGHWRMLLAGSSIFSLVIPIAFLTLLLSVRNDVHVLLSALILITVATLSTAKARLRQNAISRIFARSPQIVASQSFTQLVLWAPASFVFFYNCLRAAFSRTINWRGITYRMHGPSRVEIVSRSKG